MVDKGLQMPVVHLNGTGKETLLVQYENASVALRKAVDALYAMECNARDYYPLGDQAFTRALGQQLARIESVRRVLDEVGAIWEHVQEAGK
jgi:hypothetical protein